MTYRSYLRWSGQRASDNTATDDAKIAVTHLRELVVAYKGKPCAAVLSADNKQRQYIQLDNVSDWQNCKTCHYRGPFIDDGEACPNCIVSTKL